MVTKKVQKHFGFFFIPRLKKKFLVYIEMYNVFPIQKLMHS